MDIKVFLTELQGYWGQRKMEMLKRWDFYYGAPQRYYLPKFTGEDEQEFTARINGASIENHCAKTADVIVGYIYGQPNCKSRVKVRVTDAEGKIVEDAQRLFRDNIWRYNDFDSFRIDMALMASVTGYAVIHKEFIDSRTGIPFENLASKADKIKYGTIRLDVWDSSETMPIPFVSASGVIYPRKLGGIVRAYAKDNFSGNTFIDRLLAKRYTQEDVVEFFDNSQMIRATLKNGIVETELELANPYEDVTVPFTVLRNYGDPMYIEGESDLAQLMELQNVLNELVNDDRATIAYHSFPILMLTKGAKMPPNFIRKVNSVLEMDGEQEAKYLVWDNVLEASEKLQEVIRRQMTVVSGVSQMSRGNASDIGQVRSGAGLKTLFQADINTIGLKIPYFRKAEKELVYSCLKMWEIETGQTFEYVNCEVEFPEDFVGLDELVKAQTESLEIQENTRSIRDTIREKHPDVVSEEEIDEIVKRILDEKKKFAKIEADVKAAMKPQSPDKKSQEQSI